MIPDLSALVIARLGLECEVLRQISGAAGIEVAEQSVKTAPAAFVLPLAERPTAPPLAAEFRQRIEVATGVLLCVSHLGDPRGDAARAALVPVRQAVRSALAGWKPEGCTDPLAIAGGRLVRLGSGVLWWQDDFVTSYMETL